MADADMRARARRSLEDVLDRYIGNRTAEYTDDVVDAMCTFATTIAAEATERAARVADAHARSRAILTAEASNKFEKRDHDSMGLEARLIAAAIRNQTTTGNNEEGV